MSADYDRLFNSAAGDEKSPRISDGGPDDDNGSSAEVAEADRAKAGPPQLFSSTRDQPSVPREGADAPSPRPTLPGFQPAAEFPQPTEVKPEVSAPPPRPVRSAPQAWPSDPGGARVPDQQLRHDAPRRQATVEPTQAAFEQAHSTPMSRPVPPPIEHFTEGRTEIVSVWPVMDTQVGAPAQTSAAQIGNHRAIDALSHVGVKSAVKMPSKRGWRHVLYVLTRINLGLSADEIYELDLIARIRRTARDSYQIGVLGLKGGAGKTTVTVALGSTLSKVRGDRILAIDADPDGGNLADRSGRQSAASISDLLADKELSRYNDIRAYTSMNTANLEVLASQDYSTARRAFGPEDWETSTNIVSRYYNLVLADCGAGLFHPATRSVLSTVAGLVIVASASLDGARQAAVTLDWLRQNGYQDLLGRTCVVINHVTPGKPNIDVQDVVQQFERHVPAGRVIVLPYDKHIASGTEVNLDLLSSVFRRRTLELAAALSDDFERLDRR